MAIYRLIKNSTFKPGEALVMTCAYECALIDLKVEDRNDPITDPLATAILHLLRGGEIDPDRLAKFAVRAVGHR